MKIVIVGATGFVGKALVKEASDRGLEVTAAAREAGKVPDLPGVKAVSADVKQPQVLKTLFQEQDAVVNAFNAGWQNPNLYQDFMDGCASIQKATHEAGVKRLLVIGGAGSLFIDGQQLVDTPAFPAEWKQGATAARDYLNILVEDKALDWTFVSPAIELVPGKRTAKFRLGADSPVFDQNGKSRISVEDLAVAVINELEEPEHIRQRFTLGY